MRLWGVFVQVYETLDKSAIYLESNLLHFLRVICNACLCVCVCVCAMRVFASVHMYSYKMHVDRNYAKKFVNMYMYTMSNIS